MVPVRRRDPMRVSAWEMEVKRVAVEDERD